jgi:hypothetical protein
VALLAASDSLLLPVSAVRILLGAARLREGLWLDPATPPRPSCSALLRSLRYLHPTSSPTMKPSMPHAGGDHVTFDERDVQTPTQDARQARTSLLHTSLPWKTAATSVHASQSDRTRDSMGLAPKEPSFLKQLLFVLQTWWKEWVLLCLATGILIAIVVVLRCFNDQPQPNWSLGLNLNTIIAVLATLLRSSLVTIVEEGNYSGSHVYSDLTVLPSQWLAKLSGSGSVILGRFSILRISIKQVGDLSGHCCYSLEFLEY